MVNTVIFSILFFTVALVFTPWHEASFTLPKLAYLYSCTFSLVISWLYCRWRGQILPLSRNIEYATGFFALWLVLSTVFALHIPTALIGNYGRWNGLITHLVYLLLFLMAATLPLNRRRVLQVFVLTMLCVAVISITQRLNFVNSPILGGRSFSTIGNPVLMGACLALAVPFSVYFTVQGKWIRILWGLITLILLAGIVMSESRGPQVGLLVGLSIMLLGSIRRKTVAVAGIGVLLIALLYFNPRYNIKHISTDSGFTNRIRYAQVALSMTQDFPVFGVGLENYRVAYLAYRTPESAKIEPLALPTKAHNGYLQYAATIGIPGLIYYLILVGTVLFRLPDKFFERKPDLSGFTLRQLQREANKRMSYMMHYLATHPMPKPEDRLLRMAFVASITSLLIQDISGWQEISLTAFFWVIMGLAVRREPDDKEVQMLR